MKIDTNIEIKTIGDLKRAIKYLELEDDTILIFNDRENEEAVEIKIIDTYWHGALTFNI